MKPKTREASDDLRPEYDFDFSKGERGRYYKRLLKEGSNNAYLSLISRKHSPTPQLSTTLCGLSLSLFVHQLA